MLIAAVRDQYRKFVASEPGTAGTFRCRVADNDGNALEHLVADDEAMEVTPDKNSSKTSDLIVVIEFLLLQWEPEASLTQEI